MPNVLRRRRRESEPNTAFQAHEQDEQSDESATDSLSDNSIKSSLRTQGLQRPQPSQKVVSMGIDDSILVDDIFATKIHNETRININTKELAKFEKWLDVPDPSINHINARGKHQKGSGQWLLKDERYIRWKEQSNSFMWINGVSGCGKTLLCSTIIEDIGDIVQAQHRTSLAYFYFDINDRAKQTSKSLLSYMVLSLTAKSKNYDPMDRLYNRHDGLNFPTENELLALLVELLEDFEQTYMVIDALDECGHNYHQLFNQVIKVIHGWQLPHLHLLVTSRTEKSIIINMKEMASTEIYLSAELVGSDIISYVHSAVENDPRYMEWGQTIQEQVENALISNANGIFRWVACQIEELKCCTNQRVLMKTLRSLPNNLEGVYDQILHRIEKKEIPFAKFILQWLLLGMRLFTVEELAIALTFDQSGGTSVTSLEVPHTDNVIHLCHSLVLKATNNTVQLAHSSVKEYFLHKPRTISLSDVHFGHAIMTHFCLRYIQESKESDLKEIETLWHYSIWHWADHYKLSNKNARLQATVLKFLCDKHGGVETWARYVSRAPAWIYSPVTPLDYAAELGLEDIVEKMIITNKWHQKYSEAVQIAAQEGHIGVVRLLLDEGADVNAQSGEYCNALQAASYNGHDDMVRLLLDRGANVNAKGGKYCHALQAASSGGHATVARILLGEGAYVNAQGGHYGNALLAASFRGHADIVRLLLSEGADVNAQGGYYGNALQAASSMGYIEIARLLLNMGAHVDEMGGFEYGSALIAALKQNHTEIARLLLDKGANVNMGVPYHYPLEIASFRCNSEFVRLLLDKGAYINVQGERYGGALQAAALQANVDTIRLLLDRGANVNARGGEYGSALQAASAYGISQVVRLLLDKGADVNAKGGKYGNALQAAKSQGHMRVVELLFSKGAYANREYLKVVKVDPYIEH